VAVSNMRITLEIIANLFNAASIWLAGRNSIHTWWTGICGCALFAWIFYDARLYADVTLQGFFIASCCVGLWRWRRGAHTQAEAPIRSLSSRKRVLYGIITTGLSLGYAWVLQHYTNAALPYIDSLVLGFSVLGQGLLVARVIENWWCWILVNTLAVPLYALRELYVTAALYACFWVNGWIALRHWQGLMHEPASQRGGLQK
jgi:nicotinamide mononucleotide transporter